jgi:DNA-directed RNA polymerase specialized sigma24 family protein
MSDIDTIIDKVRARVYLHYRTHGEVDDLMQEASIHAWKRWEESPDWDEARIVYHAVMKAKSLVSAKSGEVPTGKPKNTSTQRKQSNGEASREKLKTYIRDYTKLHGEEPTTTQIARDLGMSTTNVRFHRKRLHLFDTAIDQKTAKVYSLDAGLDASAKGEDSPPWMGQMPHVLVDYEGAATASEVREAVRKLKDRERLFLYLEFWQEKTYVEIGRELGLGGGYVNKLRKQILANLREDLAVA